MNKDLEWKRCSHPLQLLVFGPDHMPLNFSFTPLTSGLCMTPQRSATFLQLNQNGQTRVQSRRMLQKASRILWFQTQSVFSQQLDHGPFSIYNKPEAQRSDSNVKTQIKCQRSIALINLFKYDSQFMRKMVPAPSTFQADTFLPPTKVDWNRAVALYNSSSPF